MADRHNGGGEPVAHVGIQGLGQGTDQGPTQRGRQGCGADAAIIGEGETAVEAPGESGFGHHPGVAAGTEDQEGGHVDEPVNGAMVASPAALIPSL